MLILILIISIILAIIGAINSYEDWGQGLIIIGGLIAFLSGIFLLFMLLSFPYNVEEKIVMYEEENLKIETKIKNTVRDYMEYEQETYDKIIKNADLATIVLKYPELNSNELIKTEIETYKENSALIKKLKSDQIDKSTMAWWIYFGS